MAAKEKNDLEHLDHDRSLAGDHPVGTGVGAAGGAVAGATAGAAIGGPVAAVVGGVIGAVAGGLVGRGAAEAAHPEPQDDQHEHNVGTGIGVGGGAMAAAAAGGGVAGPVGAGVGAVAGGPAGKGLAPAIDHDEEDAYWREHHVREPYYNPERSYEDYGPAYRMGWESRARYDQGDFDTYEPSFRNDWDESYRAQSRLTWAEARHAARAGWERFERKLPGDADGDGR